MQDYDHHDDDLGLDEHEPVEAYCVHCKQTIEMENPVPVWTRKGTPGTRGACPICGNVVFRMGRSDAHIGLQRPDIGQMLGGSPHMVRKGRASTRYAAFINFSPADAVVAARIADDLVKSGIPTWYAKVTEPDAPLWASGVHPALTECSHMVVVLSQSAAAAPEVEQSWAYFRGQRKPVVVAQVGPCDVPDDLRSRPRFDFTADYKTAFRQMVQALAG